MSECRAAARTSIAATTTGRARPMAAMARKDNVYLLPAATQLETEGSVTASNRSLQWRERVIEPLFEARTDHMIMYQLAQKFGFDKQFVAKIKLQKGKGGMDEPSM